ncbi:MAG TPA: SGNH/GDSL hydrolase family protein [Myxococcota bacterium]|nr:SGNH/GDSL hydrolase family protein [Myxococcota bacterium]HRY91883.1 SGNH/GDSL hydrolase family protein [Myxococcota bacterium]
MPIHPYLRALRERLARGERVRLLGLGDSLTAGWEVSRGFFDRFADGLAARFPRASLVPVQAGVPGDTAEGGLGRVGRLLAPAPELAVVQFGLNDASMGVPVAAYAGALEGIGRRLLDAGSAAVLVTSCPLPDPEGNRWIRPYYDAVRRVGAALGCAVAELDRHWTARAGSRAARALWGRDGVHPTDDGHALLAEGLLALLDDGPA